MSLSVADVRLSAEQVKDKGRELGADLVGIASCDALNANPPDPAWPQVPSRISDRARSCIVLAKRMPIGEFLSEDTRTIAHTNQVVMRRLEGIAYELSHWMDGQGHYSFQIAADETDPQLKRGSYGYLSTRHVAVEAGLGTFGLEANLLTPEYGPRVYVTAVLTEAELEPDHPIEEQICLGESCGRCLLGCPSDAVLQWGLDKRKCATHAQRHGISSIIYGPLRRISDAKSVSEAKQVIGMRDTFEKWRSVIRLVMAFGVCPRCIEVCPLGEDYRKYLAKEHRSIAEKNSEKAARLNEMKLAAKEGLQVRGAPHLNLRFVGVGGRKGQTPKRA